MTVRADAAVINLANNKLYIRKSDHQALRAHAKTLSIACQLRRKRERQKITKNTRESGAQKRSATFPLSFQFKVN